MPNNTIYEPQAPNPKKYLCHVIYLLCTRAFRSRRHLRFFILTVQSEIGLQCTKFPSKTTFINDFKSCVFLFNSKTAVIFFSTAFRFDGFQHTQPPF